MLGAPPMAGRMVSVLADPVISIEGAEMETQPVISIDGAEMEPVSRVGVLEPPRPTAVFTLHAPGTSLMAGGMDSVLPVPITNSPGKPALSLLVPLLVLVDFAWRPTPLLQPSCVSAPQQDISFTSLQAFVVLWYWGLFAMAFNNAVI